MYLQTKHAWDSYSAFDSYRGSVRGVQGVILIPLFLNRPQLHIIDYSWEAYVFNKFDLLIRIPNGAPVIASEIKLSFCMFISSKEYWAKFLTLTDLNYNFCSAYQLKQAYALALI